MAEKNLFLQIYLTMCKKNPM